MAIYELTSGTFIVTGGVLATVLAVTYGTFTYRGGGITPTPAITPATRPVRLTPVIAPAKGDVGRRGLFNLRHQIASHAVRLTAQSTVNPRRNPWQIQSPPAVTSQPAHIPAPNVATS
jgi:hypothetical protein